MEFVYVVPRADLFDLEFPQGFHPVTDEDATDRSRYLDRIHEHGYFVQRSHAEEDSSLKQVIPYLVVHHEGEVLEVERLEEQSEERLHAFLSIGLGGHLNPEDDQEDTLLSTGMQRELHEELHLDAEYDTRYAGIVNDDSNPVGSVHFGVVHRVDLASREVEIRETDRMKGTFRSVEKLRSKNREAPEQYETWSRMVIEKLPRVLDA